MSNEELEKSESESSKIQRDNQITSYKLNLNDNHSHLEFRQKKNRHSGRFFFVTVFIWNLSSF